jgi:hypothetical protein
MAKETNTNTLTIDDEVIDINTLSDESKLYLDHLLDIEKQLTKLTFKSQQLRTAKTAFLSMFNNSRNNKQKE